MYAGSDAGNLTRLGITHILCVLVPDETNKLANFANRKILSVQDWSSEKILPLLSEAVEYIDSALKEGGRVLVHCRGGRSRSSTCVIAYIMWKQRISMEEAF